MTAPAISPASAQLLAWAEQILRDRDGRAAGCWSRAVVVLTRQALEAALAELWQVRGLALAEASMRAQLLCLPTYLGDKGLAARMDHTWSALSTACHHHPYELAPTAAELAGWLQTVRSLSEVIAQGAGVPARAGHMTRTDRVD